LPSDDLSTQPVSNESNASDLDFLGSTTDYTAIDDTRIFYTKAGSSALNYVRLGADDTVSPNSVNGGFVFAERDDNGALQGFAWQDSSTGDVKFRDFDSGNDTTLESSVGAIETAGFVDGKRVVIVDGDLKTYDTGGDSFGDVNQGSTVAGLDISDKAGQVSNDAFDNLYLFAAVDSGNVRLIEINLDADPEAKQLADTGDGFGYLAGLGDDRIAWSSLDGTKEVESFSLSDGSRVELASGNDARARIDDRARGGFVFVNQTSRAARAIEIGNSSEVVLNANDNGPSNIGGGVWDSDGTPFTYSRIAFTDAGGEIVTVDRAKPGDTDQQVTLGNVDTGTYMSGYMGSYQPDVLVGLDRQTGDSDIGYVDPDEADSLEMLTQDPDINAYAVNYY